MEVRVGECGSKGGRVWEGKVGELDCDEGWESVGGWVGECKRNGGKKGGRVGGRVGECGKKSGRAWEEGWKSVGGRVGG